MFYIRGQIGNKGDAVEHWDYSRSMGGIVVLVEFAVRRGVPIAQLLEGSRITRTQLRAPEVEIAAVQELRVLHNLVAALGDPVRLGIAAGQQFHFATFGVWGLALVSSATGREAIARALRFLPLTHAFTAITFEERGDARDSEAILSFAEPALDADVRDFIVARDMTTAATLLSETLGRDVTPRHVRMTARPRPDADAPLPDLFGTRIETGAAANQIVFDPAVLTRPQPQANPVTAAMCETLCRDRLERQQHGLKTSTLSALYRNIDADHAPGRLSDFARLANTSERTVKRRLKTEGTSFRALSADGRQMRAERLLADARLSIGDIADELGFSDLSSFSQAFKRWTGVAPSLYRKRLHGGSGG
ncbi:AraC family transcriptional regulator [Sphingomonadaceae bacterium jetA1]|uniref:AraC family transcriptional regulator n=1 Tax=Facivitalis istanbulensis TaxID=3075838 RepID=UPI003485460D